MSAYNRKMLKKKSPSLGTMSDAEMDESGYMSFRVQHNSTVEAPFLLERDCEIENCRNATNTTLARGFASSLYQTPSDSHSRDEFWSKNYPLTVPASRSANSFDEPYGTPNLQDVRSVPKRRRKHFLAPHSSPKKSKKLLFPQPDEPLNRRRYFDGLEHCDIFSMLSQTQPALECILKHVNGQTLDVMTKVSKSWEQTVYKSQRSVERLQNHRLKMSLTKENPYLPKRRHNVFKTNSTVPLQTSNSINSNHNSSLFDTAQNSPQLMDADAGRVLKEQTQRIKCPRCGKGSRVFVSEAARDRSCEGSVLLSQTLPPIRNSFAISGRPAMSRFLSLDLEEIKGSQPTYNFAECTSVICKFRFCINCLCKSHPGERCLVTELGTPSKLMMPSERLTPPPRNQRQDYKLKKKNSLKRLCF
ncbi:uncharacterized protein LOC117902567 [Drosophila subobscura]|uniref:uncharacterized protein LOC117902567 n=1 Tax=Drosophila subobscura TaxID=7241 RepID=UPI00155AE8CB|nr:uncharacterized protein LOC117902567 [Drosophila subobscura]